MTTTKNPKPDTEVLEFDSNDVYEWLLGAVKW